MMIQSGQARDNLFRGFLFVWFLFLFVVFLGVGGGGGYLNLFSRSNMGNFCITYIYMM